MDQSASDAIAILNAKVDYVRHYIQAETGRPSETKDLPSASELALESLRQEITELIVSLRP